MGEDNTNDNDWGIDRRTMIRGAATASTIGLLGVPGLASAASTVATLYADQDTEVGEVSVTGSGGSLNVEYDLDDGWRMTESHVHVTENQDGFPTAGRGNPKVGNFEYSTEHEPAVTEYTYDNLVQDSDGYVATHAVVEEYEVNYASAVESSDQGTTKNGGEIAGDRDDPTAALVPDYPEGGEFFSLGFGTENGGTLEVSFDCPVVNAEGDDLRIWEVTFGGGYPLETAEVYAWDETNDVWVSLGEADNTDQGPQGTPDAHTISDFDLGELDSTSRIKLVDTTDPGPHNGSADAFDVDGIQALHDCVLREETAWGEGTEFVDGRGGSWATYFEYDVSES